MKKRKPKAASAKPPRIPRDPVTGQQFIFDPATGEPTRRYRRRKTTAEEIEAVRARRAASRQTYEANRAAFRARIGRRPVEMQHVGYTLPADVSAFLLRLHRKPPFYADEKHVSIADACEIAEAAYMEGCRQGYVEGFVVGRMPDKKRSKTGNDGKRKKLLELPDGSKMTRHQRNKLIAEEYESLRALRVKKTPAMDRLAGKYGLGSWQAVAGAIEAFHKGSGG